MSGTLVYDLALFLHVLGAFGLIAAFSIEGLALRGLRRAEDRSQALSALANMRLVQRFAPGSIGTILVTGLYMMAVSWKAQGWILAALAGLVLIALVGGLLTGVRMARVGPALGRAPQALPPELQAGLRDPMLQASLRLRLALTLGIAFLMTVKPSAPASVLVLALAAAAGWLAGLALDRRTAWARS
jgi:hypothetical protein